ncbi:MAG: hypothetical protein IKQ04_04400 [Oscillospiraceae bacterium]|nr:hypothetical protein [Oscillospiraceae bacterium]
MPNTASKTPRELPRPDAVRPGETWKQYIDRQRAVNALGASQMVGIVTATVLMGKNPDAPANGRMLETLAQRVGKQSSFRALTRDPEALRLARGGKGAEMIVLMGEHKKARDEMLRKYSRDPNLAKQDAAFFRNVTKSIRDSMANHQAAQRERESKQFLEMMKQLDHARSLAEQGIALDGKTARQLAQAVKRYNDGGGKTPGGKTMAAASKEALCVMKRVMPAEEFADYCSSVNRAHKAQSPAHRRYVDPQKYGEELLTGGARSARDLMRNSQRHLNRGMTLDGCAMVTAIMKLSQGNPNAIISRGELEAEVGRLKTPGSAFLKAMSDPDARGKYSQLAADGKVATLSKTIIHDAKAHSVRSAQWQIRQSQSSAAREGTGASVEKLAYILAARQMAASADPGQNITNGAFKARAEQIRSSPAFAELASQYQKDGGFRDRINNGLTNGDGGKALEQEYQKMNTPRKEAELSGPSLKPTLKN